MVASDGTTVATVDAFPPPKSFPAFTAITVDVLGYLWVREYNTPGCDTNPLPSALGPGPRSCTRRLRGSITTRGPSGRNATSSARASSPGPSPRRATVLT